MRLLLAGLALFARLISPAAAAVEQTDIFVAGRDGYSVYRIPAVITFARFNLQDLEKTP